MSLLSSRIIIFFVGYSSYDNLSNKQHRWLYSCAMFLSWEEHQTLNSVENFQ